MVLVTLGRPSKRACLRYLERAQPPPVDAPSFASGTSSSKTGKCLQTGWIQIANGNQADFHAVCSLVLRLFMFHLNWCFATTDGTSSWDSWSRYNGGVTLGSRAAIAVQTPFQIVWATNPVQVSDLYHDSTSLRLTLQCCSGHLLLGEEMFQLKYSNKSGSIWLNISSISAPAGPLGTISLPIIRLLQGKFLTECASGLLSELQGDG